MNLTTQFNVLQTHKYIISYNHMWSKFGSKSKPNRGYEGLQSQFV